jgi:hypothetical protein
MTEAQAQRTRFLAQALGPFLVFVAAIIFMRYETLTDVLPMFINEAPLMLVTGVFTLFTGCLLFAAHHHFNSPAAIAVSLLALIFIARGAALTVVPDFVVDVATHVAQTPVIMLGLTAVSALIGVWLTFVGWIAKTV